MGGNDTMGSEDLTDLLLRGFEWMKNYPDRVDENLALMQRVMPIFRKLKRLGITKKQCWDALFLGVPISNQLEAPPSGVITSPSSVGAWSEGLNQGGAILRKELET